MPAVTLVKYLKFDQIILDGKVVRLLKGNFTFIAGRTLLYGSHRTDSAKHSATNPKASALQIGGLSDL